MGFDAGTLALVEDALSDCFQYHSALDTFLRRSGVSPKLLSAARERAEKRNADSGRFAKAPKRFVVQEVLSAANSVGPEGDKLIAALVTGLTRTIFRDASPDALDAIAKLKAQSEADRSEIEETRRAAEADRARSARAVELEREAKRAGMEAARDSLRDRFLGLRAEGNAQRRGYLLETFLNDLFEYEGLDPRRSFRLLGEQIDGSFAWRSRTCLVEAKWVKEAVAGAEFGAFNYKLEGKTLDTRGLYISINGYSPEAIRAMNAKGSLKFVCVDGAHIMRALVSSEGLAPILERVWRHADETGESYLPVSKL
jgi:hypothetical protein